MLAVIINGTTTVDNGTETSESTQHFSREMQQNQNGLGSITAIAETRANCGMQQTCSALINPRSSRKA
eukprot:6470340-Amphidinium_carterae.1